MPCLVSVPMSSMVVCTTQFCKLGKDQNSPRIEAILYCNDLVVICESVDFQYDGKIWFKLTKEIWTKLNLTGL